MQRFDMRTCMLCKRGDRVFSICYRSAKYSAKDDIIEFFGMQVEPFLFDDDVICNTCMNMLDNLANLKRRLYPIICKNSLNQQSLYDIKPDARSPATTLRFKVWDTFLTNIRMSELSDYHNRTTPSPCGFGRLNSSDLLPPTSPNDLLQPTYAVSYNYADDYGSLGLIGSRSGTPFADKEIQNVFKSTTRRKRKGHNWTRRKKRGQSRNLYRSRNTVSRVTRKSRNSVYSKRSYTPASDSSYQSFYRPQSRLSATSEFPNGLRYEGGRLLNKRTRSVSRAQDEIAKRLASIEEWIHKCWDESCQGREFYNLEEFTQHKVNEHNKLALFWCDECKFKYISQEDLDKHNAFTHHTLTTYCPCCSEEMKNTNELQVHLHEHLLHSVPCIYCDKFFLSKQLCENHVKDFHRGKKRRIRRTRPQSILDRLTKDVDTDSDDSESEYNQYNPVDKQFTVKILIQNAESCSEVSNENISENLITQTETLLDSTNQDVC